MNVKLTRFQFPLKITKTPASSSLKQTNTHTQCLDVVKVNPPKKLSRDPRRLASNSRLAVSLGTLYDVYILHSMRARYGCILEKMKCVRSWNKILKLQALTFSLSIHKQIPQGWQIRHPCRCRRPGLLGRGLGILSGWSSRTRRERFQRQQKVQNRTETHPIGHQKRRGIVQVVGYGHDRGWRCLAEHPLGLVAEEVQEVND